MIDSTNENTDDPYQVLVSPDVPLGHTAQFSLIASDGAFIDTFQFTLDIGTFDYLVWNPDLTPSSGQTIHNTLTALGYIGKYTTSLSTEPQLDKFHSIFVCFGVYPSNYFINSWAPEAIALIEYINDGGRVYLEGGDVWCNDAYNAGPDFSSLFGLIGIEVGTNNMGPVIGQENIFTQGMYFTYAGANNSMDHLEPTTGFTIFKDENDGFMCGIANAAGDYKTVGASFELGGLTDSASVSTKANLLDSIMHFFGILQSGIEENNLSQTAVRLPLKVFPNPFRHKTTIHTQSQSIQIFDISGKLIKTLTNPKPLTPNSCFVWDGTNEQNKKMSAGVYFIKFIQNKKSNIKRVVLIN